MQIYPKKKKLLEIKKQSSFYNLNTAKTPTSISTKNNTKISISNNKIINQKGGPIRNTVSQYSIKTLKDKKNSRELIIKRYSKHPPHLKTYYTSQNSIENESQKLDQIKDFKKNFTKNFYNNYYDINNNNYYVNLFNSTASIPSKYKGRNSVIDKNFAKINSRNLNYNSEIDFTKTNKTNYYETSVTEPDNYNETVYYHISDTKEMLNNYRNKLLNEFMKYLKKFYVNYYKKYFLYFINKLKSIKKKPYIYSKKIQKQAYIKSKIFKKIPFTESLALSKKRKDEKDKGKEKEKEKEKKREENKNKKIFINKNVNYNSINLTERKIQSKSIASKIINNRSKELDGKIRNIFLDSSFLNEVNSNDTDSFSHIKIFSSIDNNRSYRAKRHKILMGDFISPCHKYSNNTISHSYNNGNYKEIKIDFNYFENPKKYKNEILSSFDRKINLRFNHLDFQGEKIKKENNINNIKLYQICNLVDSFSIITEDSLDPQDYQKIKLLEGRKKYFNMLKNRKFLSSIKEEDEKFSLSIQDSIPGDNNKILVKDNIYSSPYIQCIMRFKTIINSFCKEKFKKLLLNKIKDIALSYKTNKDKK